MKPGGSKVGLRTVAVFEAAKGALVLFVAFGLPGLTQYHTRHFLERLARHFHLNPERHYPRMLLQLADILDTGLSWLFIASAAIYAGVRFAEAYGLWRQRTWGEWLGCLGAALYLPWEVHYLIHHPGWLPALVLATNLAIVIYLAACLRTGLRLRTATA